MKTLNVSILGIPIPARMQSRPISSKGYPVPWFVAFHNGDWDFRVIGPSKIESAVKRKLCWLCGQPLGTFQVFTIGPMCTVNRVSAEPPSHLECAEYAARACPFLTKPKMRRNEEGMPEEAQPPAGIMLKRNPGVTALWTTRKYQPFRAGAGVLFDIGEPERVQWFAEGRTATRAEVMASISSGMPFLETEARKEGKVALEALAKCFTQSQSLLPSA
jgi:ferredoxin